MSRSTVYDVDTPESSLFRGEEDLVDYDDSDVEIETGDDKESLAVETSGEIDSFVDDTTHTGDFNQKNDSKKDFEEPVREADTMTASATALTATKTPEAAAAIKSLNDLLTDATFRAALGLVEAGDTVDLSFWADGLDFVLGLTLTGTADVKPCKYGAKCRNAKCTFDHGSADRAAAIAAGKPRKLCSMVNTPTGCSKDGACWFSHDALGVTCADGDLRATCMKGVYCVYKHSDDETVATVEQVENQGVKETQTPAQTAPSVETTPSTESESVPAALARGTATHQKQLARGIKRRCEIGDETEDRPEKAQRVEVRQSHRVRSDERAESGNPGRGSSQPRRGGCGYRGRGRCRRGTGGKGDTYPPSEGRQRGEQNPRKKEPPSKRMSCD